MKHSTLKIFVCSLLFSLTSLTYSVFGQNFEWAGAFQGLDNDYGQGIDIDPSGNVYSAGYYFNNIDLDPGVGAVTYTSAGQQDIYVSKLDPTGAFVWGYSIGSTLRDRCNDIEVDASGNVYLTGYFEGTVDFDPGPGTQLRTALSVRDIFILKLDTDGNFLWVSQLEGTMDGEGVSVTVDANQNVYVTGLFMGTYDFDPTAGTYSIVSAGNRDAFVMKLNSNGSLDWVVQQSGTDNVYGISINLDNNGDIGIAGFFAGTVDFVAGPGISNLTSAGSFDIYVLKLDNSGNFLWVRGYGSAGQERGEGIITDSNNDVYVTGRFQNTVNFDPGFTNTSLISGGALDAFILKLTSNGDFVWVNQVRSAGNNIGVELEKDPLGNLYATGYYTGTADFIFQNVTTTLTAASGSSSFVQKFNPAGEEIWIHSIEGAGSSIAADISVADNWDIHTTGYFNSTANFDPGISDFSITSVNLTDVYVHKMSQTCAAPVITTVGTLSSMLCPGVVDSTRVYVDGMLNDAVEWSWYSGSCGGTFLGTGDSLTVRPSVTTTYFVRGTGACGAPQPCGSVTVNVDNTPPVITLTTPITVNTDPGTCYYPSSNLTPPTVTDADCAVDTVYNDAAVLLLPGTTNVTWTAIDVNGNMSTEVQAVTVVDAENPSIDAPADMTVSADVNCQATGVALGTPLTVDNCSVISVTNDAPGTFPLGLTVVTWTATDAAGNIGTDTQNVTVVDDTDPTIVGLPANINVNNTPGVCSRVVSWVAPTVNDNCPGATISQTSGGASGSSFPVGVTTIQYTATDGAGNSVTGSFTITVNDNQVPTITAPADITVSADNFCSANPALGNAVTGDNCGVAGVSNNAPASFPLGNTNVTWTVTDINGNINTDIQVVTVVDDQDPVIVNLPSNINVNTDPGSCSAVVNWIAPTVTDNCAAPSISQTGGLASGSIFPLGTTIIEYTATDGSGNTSVGTFTVTVTDNENPTITAPSNVTVSTDNNCTATGVALGAPTTNDNCGVASVTNDAPAIFPLGVTTVTWTVTDNSGNTSNATQTVTVVDDVNPQINAPADLTVSADINCQATGVALGSAFTSDNCSVSSVTNDAPAVFPIGATVVTWTVTDGAGNTGTDTQVVTVVDDTDPTISGMPSNISVNNDPGVCEAVVSWTAPTVSDNCPGSVINQTMGATSGSTFPVGVTTIQYTATDNAGNTTVAAFTITVTDNELPSITAPADILVSADNFCSANPAIGNATVSDNCGIASISNDAPSSFSVGITTVTWTVTDVNGNVNTDTQDVEVVDDTNPVIVNLPANIVANVDPGLCEAVVSWTAPTATDNCPSPVIAQTSGLANGSSFPLGTSTIEYTATDASGNTTTATFTITVVDNENPVITAPSDVTVYADDNCMANNVPLGTPVTTDNCSVATVTNNAPLIYPLGVTPITWTVTDNSGNSSTAIQLVTVADTTRPSISAPLPVVAYVDTNCQVSGVNLGNPLAFDNCTVDTVYNDAPASYTTGIFTITWTAEDAFGNTNTAVQQVTILDTILPTAVLKDTTITLSVSGPISLIGSDIDTGSFDNCGLFEVVLGQEIYDCNDLGVNQVPVQVIDVNGNIKDTFIVVTVVESGIDLDFDMIDDACDDNVNTTVVTVPSGFTPNGDGINDLFIIPGMSNYSSIKLTIFNRYGSLVYESEPYENNWDGTSSKNGMELPDGTYFYVLELDGEIFNGYVQINRSM
ncbi:MAG: HYR domain-containing protein [Brumimicrobium sp.]|nr:HYR domain-containing protein [Brumimicrobium sp.]